MQTNGYSYTPDQCEGRRKTLVRGVKRVAVHNGKTGNAPKKHPFEDELEFYSERPNLKPTYLVSSTIKLKILVTVMKKIVKKVDPNHLFLFLSKRNAPIFQMSWMFLKYTCKHRVRDTKKP